MNGARDPYMARKWTRICNIFCTKHNDDPWTGGLYSRPYYGYGGPRYYYRRTLFDLDISVQMFFPPIVFCIQIFNLLLKYLSIYTLKYMCVCFFALSRYLYTSVQIPQRGMQFIMWSQNHDLPEYQVVCSRSRFYYYHFCFFEVRVRDQRWSSLYTLSDGKDPNK